jgi:hypothetical protein
VRGTPALDPVVADARAGLNRRVWGGQQLDCVLDLGVVGRRGRFELGRNRPEAGPSKGGESVDYRAAGIRRRTSAGLRLRKPCIIVHAQTPMTAT